MNGLILIGIRLSETYLKYNNGLFRAEAKGDTRQAHRLSRLLTHDKRVLLYSIRLVTQKNSSKSTPGLDDKVYLTPRVKNETVFMSYVKKI